MTHKPRLLDLFCGAGGAAMGYSRAGFEVVGVDIKPQPHYPFEFHQGDALTWLGDPWLSGYGQFDAIHASPPCQRYSAMSACRPGLDDSYPDLIETTRHLLQVSELPWVIENVPGSPLINPIRLCGFMFGLPLYRHRLFETSLPLMVPPHPKHSVPGGRAGHWKPGQIVSVSGNCAPIELARKAMGISWMRRSELAESIPPAYTEFIGNQLLTVL